MARLTLPDAGTVVTCDGELEQTMRASGWVVVEEKVETRRGRPRKTEQD